MKLSSLQLKQYFFNRLEISDRPNNDNKEAFGQLHREPFDFEGVVITTDIEIGRLVNQEEDPRDFAIILGIRIENKKGKPAPYNISAAVIGFFTVNPNINIEARQKFALVNGCSMLYGAIR